MMIQTPGQQTTSYGTGAVNYYTGELVVQFHRHGLWRWGVSGKSTVIATQYTRTREIVPAQSLSIMRPPRWGGTHGAPSGMRTRYYNHTLSTLLSL